MFRACAFELKGQIILGRQCNRPLPHINSFMLYVELSQLSSKALMVDIWSDRFV